MDKRRAPRKSVTINVKITFPSGESQHSVTRDISESGIFLILDESGGPLIGELLTLELLDDAQNTEVLPGSEAVVVRQEPDGIGLSFIDMNFSMDDD